MKSLSIRAQYPIYLHKNNTNVLCHGRGMPNCANRRERRKRGEISDLKLSTNDAKTHTNSSLLAETLSLLNPNLLKLWQNAALNLIHSCSKSK